MATTIGVCVRKGGSGKTSIATMLAVAGDGLVVDFDEQASATFWATVRNEPGRVVSELPGASAGLVVVDTPPQQAVVARVARVSSFVLVPCRPELLDLRAARSTIAMLQSVHTPFAVVLTMVPHTGPELAMATDALKALGVEQAPSLFLRKAWPRSTQLGLTPIEYEPNGAAAAEAHALWEFVRSKI